MKVELVQRWGAHKPGRTVDVDQVMGQWLLDRHLGRLVEANPQPTNQGGAAEQGEAQPTEQPKPRAKRNTGAGRKTTATQPGADG